MLAALLLLLQDKIGTGNTIVVESVKSGEAKGYEAQGAAKPKSEAELRCEQLTAALATATDENAALKARIQELELKIVQLEGTIGTPRSRQLLADAKLKDAIVNG
jgi:cell division protein FtsB